LSVIAFLVSSGAKAFIGWRLIKNYGLKFPMMDILSKNTYDKLRL
jgi:hypothetical protein